MSESQVCRLFGSVCTLDPVRLLRGVNLLCAIRLLFISFQLVLKGNLLHATLFVLFPNQTAEGEELRCDEREGWRDVHRFTHRPASTADLTHSHFWRCGLGLRLIHCQVPFGGTFLITSRRREAPTRRNVSAPKTTALTWRPEGPTVMRSSGSQSSAGAAPAGGCSGRGVSLITAVFVLSIFLSFQANMFFFKRKPTFIFFVQFSSRPVCSI